MNLSVCGGFAPWRAVLDVRRRRKNSQNQPGDIQEEQSCSGGSLALCVWGTLVCSGAGVWYLCFEQVFAEARGSRSTQPYVIEQLVNKERWCRKQPPRSLHGNSESHSFWRSLHQFWTIPAFPTSQEWHFHPRSHPTLSHNLCFHRERSGSSFNNGANKSDL